MSSVVQADNNLLSPSIPPPKDCDATELNGTEYIAIRKGSIPTSKVVVYGEEIVIRNCIFSKWDDAMIFLQKPNAVYEIFQNLEKAQDFAFDHLNNREKNSRNEYNRNEHDSTGFASSKANANNTETDVSTNDDDTASRPMIESAQLTNTSTVTSTSTSQEVVSTQKSTTVYGEVAVPVYAKTSEAEISTKFTGENTFYGKKRPANFDWEEQFSKLKEYYEKHGNKNPIKKCLENEELIRWTTQQKRNYRQLQKKGNSKLSTSQMQRLNDIGFKFVQRGNYKTWDDHIKDFLEFKEKNGHTRVPTTHPTLGDWMINTRNAYKKYLANDPHVRLTSTHVQKLKEIGFIFDSPSGNKPRAAPKTWEERFEELKQFKMQYGHATVPQKYPKLGQWVHSQRREYKQLSKGMKSKLDTAKVLKLVEIGFVFDASVFKKNKCGKADDSISDNENNKIDNEEIA